MSGEFENRLQRAREIMEQRRLQALILRRVENQFYFTGDLRGRCLTVVPLEGECFTIAPICDVSDILENSNIDRVLGVGTESAMYSLLAEELEQLGVQMVGVEHDHIHAHLFKMFKHQILPEMVVNDATPVMTELRLCKSEQEIRCISRAGRIADAAMGVARENIKPGMSEREASCMLDEVLCDGGSFAHHLPVVLSGKRTCAAFGVSGERVIREGEPLVIRITSRYRGYFACVSRTIMPGGSEGAELLDAYTSLLESAAEPLRAGVPIADYEFSMEEGVDRLGLRSALIRPMYAGVGLECEEAPLSRESAVVRGVVPVGEFREDMCVSLGSGLFLRDFGVQVCDTWLVEESRVVRLTVCE